MYQNYQLAESNGNCRTHIGFIILQVSVMDLSLTLLGGLMQKTTTTTKFSNPLQTSKNFRASFLSWKLQVNPIENHINSIWTEKFVIFFKAPLRGSKILRSPPTSVCEWSLIKCWCHGLRGGGLWISLSILFVSWNKNKTWICYFYFSYRCITAGVKSRRPISNTGAHDN